MCVCLLLQDLVQSCFRGEGGILEDMCYDSEIISLVRRTLGNKEFGDSKSPSDNPRIFPLFPKGRMTVLPSAIHGETVVRVRVKTKGFIKPRAKLYKAFGFRL